MGRRRRNKILEFFYGNDSLCSDENEGKFISTFNVYDECKKVEVSTEGEAQRHKVITIKFALEDLLLKIGVDGIIL